MNYPSEVYVNYEKINKNLVKQRIKKKKEDEKYMYIKTMILVLSMLVSLIILTVTTYIIKVISALF